jgi:cyclophilin family peptidyl-prolyl cis-trans isomerase
MRALTFQHAMVGVVAVLLAGCGKSPDPPPAAGPVVVVKTTMGAFEIALEPQRAPLTTRNFLRYVEARHYDGTVIHSVVRDFVVRGGLYTPDLERKPTGPPIANESSASLPNLRGTVAMARGPDPHSATCAFQVNVRDNANLDPQPGMPGYAVFGKVIKGIQTIDKINEVKTDTGKTSGGASLRNVPVKPIVIESIRAK